MRAPILTGMSTPPAMRAPRRRLLLLLTAVVLGGAVAAAAGALAASASAAEPGVNLPGPEAQQSGRLAQLGTHWVRMFVTWPDIEPARGVYAPNWIASYEQTFRALSAGHESPARRRRHARAWETGSPDPRTPRPQPPATTRRCWRTLAQRFGRPRERV